MSLKYDAGINIKSSRFIKRILAFGDHKISPYSSDRKIGIRELTAETFK